MKSIPDVSTTFKTTVYAGKHYECTEGICKKYIFAGSDRIANIEGAVTHYYHADHLGSSTVMTDDNAAVAQNLYYYPFGEIKDNTISDVARHKFTGQEWDGERGLYYYNARYYDPKLARFISADTIVPKMFDPQALNRYSYVANNPIKYIDPSGHGFFKKLWKSIKKVVKPVLAIAAAIVATVVLGPIVGNFVAHLGLAGAAGPATAGWMAAGKMLGGIAGFAAGGAASAAVMGGDIGQGALIGAVTWGIMGLGSIGGNAFITAGASMLAGGTAAEMSGGKFRDGLKTAGIMVVANAAASQFFQRGSKVLHNNDRIAKATLIVDGGLHSNTQVAFLNKT